MSTSQAKIIPSLLEEGYSIADRNKLYGIRKKIPKSHESDFNQDENNFGHFVQYSVNGNVYENWIEQVVTSFDGLGLQGSKLRIKINDFDPSVESNLPAQKFMRTLREIERITEDPNYLKSYEKLNSLPTVKFYNGILSQGANSHTFQTLYTEAISFLWVGREIRNQNDQVTLSAKPKTQSMFEQQTGIKRSQLANFAKALRQIQSKKNIHIQLKYPRNSNNIFLVVHEK